MKKNFDLIMAEHREMLAMLKITTEILGGMSRVWCGRAYDNATELIKKVEGE